MTPDWEGYLKMGFNTAIFYDIENLLRGYSFTQETASNLSLAEIVNAIRKVKVVDQIAMQRAYANWSDPRLAIMRGEINELGIEPMQVFGFGREPSKNAADIQLAIDAVDLAHVRPGLQVFVIVSGDGGFSALAKKLHEYGKTVVGCAYKTAASRIFQAVCDEFVLISEPDNEDLSTLRPEMGSILRDKDLTDPRNLKLRTKVRPLEQPFIWEKVLQKTHELLRFYEENSASRADLSDKGIVLSAFQEAFKYLVPGFDTMQIGFPKVVEFLQWATCGTNYCVVRRADSQPVLALRTAANRIGEILPEIELREVHSAEVYGLVLSARPPSLRLPSPEEIRNVAVWLSHTRPVERGLGAIIEDAVSQMSDQVSTESVKRCILALIVAGAFLRQPEGLPIAEQVLTLRSDLL
ncbi:MAG TPA: NYN domain-containing protein, partial [Anaerolineaceae bacterium]|nr:NYN domain-containing protein [Anaerolineaceae bacterium]